jgi:hypothetical protein
VPSALVVPIEISLSPERALSDFRRAVDGLDRTAPRKRPQRMQQSQDGDRDRIAGNTHGLDCVP